MIAANLISNPARVGRVLARGCLLALFSITSATAAPSDSDIFSVSALDSIAVTDLVLVGPVEALNRKQGTLQVLGQRVSAPSAVIDRRIGAGALVSVRGAIADDGSVLARSLALVDHSYVPGSTEVLIRGRVTSVKAAFGTLRVGSLRVDYTHSLYALDATPIQNGSLVLLAGIQPQSGGVVLAQARLSNVPNSIGGSDLESIGGSDLQSIGGSDLQSIGGSDLQSIGGSDLQSIGGSDLQSIGGSDLQSIGGSDLN